MPFCEQCQLIHGEEHRFCQRCGQLLKSSRSAAGRGCTRCGTPTFPAQKFCTECGLPLRMARVAQEENSQQEERPPLFYPRRTEPMPRRRPRRSSRIISLLGVLLVAVGVWYLWRQLPATTPMEQSPATVAAPQQDPKRDVEMIAEKIRAALLNKDINKWLSCYSSDYRNLGQLENGILELWKNYDIKSVDYRISNVQRLSNTQATADIVWNIQLYNQSTHDFDLRRLSYKITLEKKGNDWKIEDSQPETAGGSG
ncbi:MAG: double zinc ribbon domain-containing protein [Desulfobaccales bacterium]